MMIPNIDCNYKFKLYSKYKYLLEDQPYKERIMKNLRRYENKKNN